MKIAFLCKRKYMSKDVILDQYARLYEIPNQLALLGHEVECFCLSYQSHDDGIWDESNTFKKLRWHSKSYKAFHKFKIISYPFQLLQKLQNFKPDIIIGASDIPHIIMGAWLSKKLNKPFVADLYDNFESYGQAKIPFIKTVFHQALDHAFLISTTSETLAKKIQIEHPNVNSVLSMPSAINQEIFKYGDQTIARKVLNLPLNVPLIGTAGGLTKMKGINDLFEAWEIIREKNRNVYLVLAGPTEEQTPLPQDERVIYLGLLKHHQVAQLFQALDVGVMCIPDDEFGKYCFPQKAYEMLATHLSVVGANIGDLSRILNPEQLYNSTDIDDLVKKIQNHIDNPQIQNIFVPNWRFSISQLEEHFSSFVTKS